MRIGNGYDVHRLVPDRRLILGGVNIEYELGLDGHSDADVLVHAIMDALLGAAGLPDIGVNFPDTDPKYKGADSLKLLTHVAELLKENGYKIGNIDSIIIYGCSVTKIISQIQRIAFKSLIYMEMQITIKAYIIQFYLYTSFCKRQYH